MSRRGESGGDDGRGVSGFVHAFAAGRDLPHNEEAEQGLLGAILENNAALDAIEGRVTEADFYIPAHGRIFAACLRLREAGKLADPVTLRRLFQADGDLKEIGGAEYLSDLASSIVVVASAPEYADVIHDLASRRRLIEAAAEIADAAYRPDNETDAAHQIEEAESRLASLNGATEHRRGPRRLSLVIDDMHSHWSRMQNGEIKATETGLIDLDQQLGGLLPGDVCIVAGRPGMGKAQPMDSRVLTENGWVRMGDLMVGDRLASPDGRSPSCVLALHPQGERETFTVRFSDGRSVECCEDHLWRVRLPWTPRRDRIMTTREIARRLAKKSNRRSISVPLWCGEGGTDVPYPLDPWLVGALLGNGGMTQRSVTFSTADPETLERLVSLLPQDVRCHEAGPYGYRLSGPMIGPKPNKLITKLREIGIMGRRAEFKFVPEIYMNGTRATRLAILQGLLDTDGWVENGGTIMFCSVSERMAKQVQILARSLGALCKIRFSSSPKYTYNGEKKISLSAYYCRISYHDGHELFRCSQKLARIKVRSRTARLIVTAVERGPSKPMQCITVSHPSQLYVTDGYTLTHNSVMARTITASVARRDEPVLMFSQEMSDIQVAMGFVQQRSGLDIAKMRRASLEREEMAQAMRFSYEIKDRPVWIDDTSALTVDALRRRIRQVRKEAGRLPIVCIDYLQLMQAPASRERNMAADIEYLSRNIKAISKDEGVATVLLSQLSRAVESRDSKRPGMSDLRNSGGIEQDADSILLLFRGEYYHQQAMPTGPKAHDDGSFKRWEEKLEEIRGVAELIVAKNRFGTTGVVRLHFDGARGLFENAARASSGRVNGHWQEIDDFDF